MSAEAPSSPSQEELPQSSVVLVDYNALVESIREEQENGAARMGLAGAWETAKRKSEDETGDTGRAFHEFHFVDPAYHGEDPEVEAEALQARQAAWRRHQATQQNDQSE